MSSSITFKGAVLDLLRSGLYLKLDEVDGELEPAMWETKHSLAGHPWSIFQRMRFVGDLLDEVGWAERGAPAGVPRNGGPVQITTPAEAAIAVEALTDFDVSRGTPATGGLAAGHRMLRRLTPGVSATSGQRGADDRETENEQKAE